MREKWRVLWALGWVAGWVGVFASKIEAQVVGEGIEYDALVWMLKEPGFLWMQVTGKPSWDELKQSKDFLDQGNKWHRNRPSGPQTCLLPFSLLTDDQPP